MFSRHPVARALRRRRTIEAPLADGRADGGAMVDALCRWSVSQPWVVEWPTPKGHPVRRFVVECPVLDCREPWFTVSSVSDTLDEGPEVLVAVPTPIAHRGAAVGWAVSVAHLDEDRMVVAMAMPTTAPELSALKQLLEIAYADAFRRAAEGS
jgi:hypothetical protein